jgi:hypothetical protein
VYAVGRAGPCAYKTRTARIRSADRFVGVGFRTIRTVRNVGDAHTTGKQVGRGGYLPMRLFTRTAIRNNHQFVRALQTGLGQPPFSSMLRELW